MDTSPGAPPGFAWSITRNGWAASKSARLPSPAFPVHCFENADCVFGVCPLISVGELDIRTIAQFELKLLLDGK